MSRRKKERIELPEDFGSVDAEATPPPAPTERPEAGGPAQPGAEAKPKRGGLRASLKQAAKDAVVRATSTKQ